MCADDGLGIIRASRKSGTERFTFKGQELGFGLLEFWQWNSSDLVSNALRGQIAEFIVASALGVSGGVRGIWDSYDLDFGPLKIEVKSAAYIQSWSQKRHSDIRFVISPTKAWSAETNESEKDSRRQADLYIFCLLKHKDKETIDPLNLDQWDFYIVPTKALNRCFPLQKSISLQSLLKCKPIKSGFSGLRNAVEDFSKASGLA
ncbi:MAG: hypothetical protein JW727_03085 [Candidatus Aenigmarchaeota archaeon]|nr:hypothetical protein [Candidatus Aenigmarchaeota archaeon]